MAIKPKKNTNRMNFAAIRQKAASVNQRAQDSINQPEKPNALLDLDVNLIDVEKQVRHTFDEETIQELAESIRENGQISPITVRKEGSRYVIVTGERRYRAIKELGQTTIKAIIDERADNALNRKVAQLVENLQREDMNALEIGLGYNQLIEEHQLTINDVAKKTGKSRRYIYRMTSALTLPEPVQKLIVKGLLSDTQAIETLAKLYLAKPERSEALTDKLLAAAERGSITRALVDGIKKSFEPKKKVTRAEPLKDVPLTIANASKLKDNASYRKYSFPDNQIRLKCQFRKEGLNDGKVGQSDAQVLPNIVPANRSHVVVEYKGQLIEVPWEDVFIYETEILSKADKK